MTRTGIAAAIGFLSVSAAAPLAITWGEATRSQPVALAAKLLPPKVSKKIVGGEILRKFQPGQIFWAGFWEKPVAIAPSLCRRTLHTSELRNSAAPEHPPLDTRLAVAPFETNLSFATTYPRRADPQSCSQVKAYVTPAPARRGATIAALDTLTTAIAAASSGSALPFELTCQTRAGDGACADARKALATLPLEALIGVYLPPGSEPTVEFGNSGRDGASWRVKLTRTDGKLEKVELKRQQIIYH